MSRKKKPIPEHVQVADGTLIVPNTLVSYYRNGWRTGHLVEILNENSVKIQPLAPQNAHRVTVPVEDLKAIR